MTRRISPVAVCCSSDSVSSPFRASSSVNSRTFSMAMTACAAKVSSSAICLSENGSASGRRIDHAEGAPSRTSGVVSIVRTPTRRCLVLGHCSRELRLGFEYILDVDRPPVAAPARPLWMSRRTGSLSPHRQCSASDP